MSETEPRLEEIRETLICSICHDLVTLPVHAMCCEHAKQMNPACLSCVRRYYGLNSPPSERDEFKKSWGGCGCNVYPRNRQPTSALYTHTTQLDMMRNLFGSSKCTNEGCNVECKTSAELRRHLNGNVSTSDTNRPCLKAITRCHLCNFFGKRELVKGDHYLEYHSQIYCRICDRRIPFKDAECHYNHHVKHLYDFRQDLNSVKINLSRNNANMRSSSSSSTA
jgi:hypothetical protein